MTHAATARSFFHGSLLSTCLLLLAAGCDRSATTPVAGNGLALSLAVNLAGGAAEAFDKANSVVIRLERNGVVVFQAVESFASDGDHVRMRVPVDRELDGQSLVLHVELMRDDDLLFTGTAPVTPAASPASAVRVDLRPVVAAIVPPPDPLITEIGARLQLTAAEVFATGDTLSDTGVIYDLLTTGVLRLLPDGVVEALAEGTARVRATAGPLSIEFDVRVRIAVGAVIVSPASALIGLGGSARFTAVALAQNGEALAGRTVEWSSANTGVATIDASGVAFGVAPGSASIVATVDGVAGNASLTVSAIPPPAAPTDAVASSSGTSVSLTWRDNATNETSYEIHRGPEGAALSLIATLGPNVTSYVDRSLTADQVVDYVVRVCADGVCVDSDRLQARTVPAPPSGLAVLLLDPNTNVFRIGWQDGSAAETRFDIEGVDPQGVPFKIANVPANVTEYQSTGSPGQTERFQVVACNDAGCSAPTNVVELSFTLPPPLATTLPSNTGTEMVGVTDGFGMPHTWWFEFDTDPGFSDPSTIGPYLTSASATRIEPLFDMLSLETIYYRIGAQNNAGTSLGVIEAAKAPQLSIGTASSSEVCLGSFCSTAPPSVTFTATSSGPIGTYANPFADVTFDIDGFPGMSLGIGTVSVVDDGGSGQRIYTYTFTWTVNYSVSPGNYFIVARGYPSSEGGNVITSALVITVASS